jgi:hypothetical protein
MCIYKKLKTVYIIIFSFSYVLYVHCESLLVMITVTECKLQVSNSKYNLLQLLLYTYLTNSAVRIPCMVIQLAKKFHTMEPECSLIIL